MLPFPLVSLYHQVTPMPEATRIKQYCKYCLREFLLVFLLPYWLLLLSLFSWPLFFLTSKGDVPQLSSNTSVLFYVLSVGDLISFHNIKCYFYADCAEMYISTLDFTLKNRVICTTSLTLP